MSADQIDKLYQYYDVLNTADDKKLHEREYKEILEAAHGSEKEKKLAAQFIPKFHKHFPELTETAIDKELDLCEDDDIQIRRMAIKELPAFCKDAKENTPRISDILAQLLNASDPTEVVQVNTSLSVLSKFDPLGTATGLFSQITQGDESTRIKCLQYINTKFMKGGSEIFTKESEELIIAETKKLLQDVSADEFQNCIQILSNTKLGKSITGHQELVKLCMEQADLEAEVDNEAALDETTEIFLTCATQALPFFSSAIETTPFVKFACEKFLPLSTWKFIGATEGDPVQTQLRFLKTFAELCTNCGVLDNPKEKIGAVFEVLMEFLPPPPTDYESIENLPSILFSHVECLLYALHTLGKQCTDYLGFKDDAEKLKDYQMRLTFLARATQGYVKKLQDEIKGSKITKEPKTDEEKLKIIGLSTTSNINTLIRDLFKNSYKSVVRLSWVTPKSKSGIIKAVPEKTAEVEEPSQGVKRHAPITFESDSKSDGQKAPKQARQQNQHVYKPPSGKFSSRFNSQRGGGGNGGGNRKFGSGGGGGNRQFGGGNNRNGRGGFRNRNNNRR